MPRASLGHPNNFMVKSWVFKDDKCESEAKTNSGPRVCLLFVEGPHFACVEHAQCLLLAHCVSTHTHTRVGCFFVFHRAQLATLGHTKTAGI